MSELSPELARDWGLLAGPNERSMRRRIGWVWGLLFFNVMTYTTGPTNLIPLPHQVGKALPETGAGSGPPPHSDGEQEAPRKAQHLAHSVHGDVSARGTS